jgi:hypothetical protein
VIGTIDPLIGALTTVVSALACGLIAFRLLGIALRRVEHQLLAFMTGSAILSVLILGMAALHLARKGAFFGLAVCLILLAYRYRPNVAFESLSLSVPRWLPILSLTVTAPFAVMYLITAWAPEVSSDGSGYHLGKVLRFWANHGLIPIRNMYGALPEALEMLFLFAFSIGRHSAAALVHFSFLIALPLLVLSYSLRFGLGKAGFLAAVLVFLSPVIGTDGSVAYNDVALAAAAFTVVYLIELWLEQRQGALLILAGILAGFCFGIKYTGVVAIVYAFSQIAFQAARDRSLKWREILLFALPCAIIAGPWLIKNSIYMHNPLAPFFNSVFPNPYVSPKFETDYTGSMAHYAGTTNLRELVVKYTTTGAGVVGFLGPLFLLAPLSLIALRSPRGRRLLLAAAIFGLPILLNGGTRFLIPAAPCLALTIAMAFAEVKFAVPGLILLHAVASWPAVEEKYCHRWAWHIAGFPVRAVFDGKAASDYLRANLGTGGEMGRIIDRAIPPGGKIFCFSCPPQAYTLRGFTIYYESLESRALWDMLWTPTERGRQPLKQVVLSFPPLLTTRLRVVLLQSKPDLVWSVAELHLLNAGREVPRSPRWKIHASPDPWEAPFAFDNSPVSRWSTEQYGAKGAFLEVAFDRPEAVDSVMLECPEDAPEQIGLRADVSPRGMVPVSARVHSIAVRPPVGMRRAAIKMLENYGFAYLIVSDGDYYADDYKKYADFWGMRSVAKAGDWTLYHLE